MEKKKHQNFYLKIFIFWGVVKFSVYLKYLNRRVFVMAVKKAQLKLRETLAVLKYFGASTMQQKSYTG